MKRFFVPLFHGRDKKKSDPAEQAQGQMDVICSPLETMVDAFRSAIHGTGGEEKDS